MEKIDVKLITDNLVELLTNSINISSLLQQMFDSETPATVELEQYTYNEESEKIVPTTVMVDNIAKMKGLMGSATAVMTMADYNALPEKESDTLYFII